MQVPQSIPAVYVHTTGGHYNALRDQGYAAFLSPDQQARLEAIRQGRMLFDGQHYEYFVGEGRTQFEFPLVRCSAKWRGNSAGGAPAGMTQLYLRYNVLGLITRKGADLLFGQEPILRADDEVQQQKLADLVRRTSLHALLYGCAVDCSYERETFLEACVHQGEVYLRQLPADETFPEGELGPDLQYPSYVRYRMANVGTAAAPVWLLLVIRYLPGSIERHLHQLGEDGRPLLGADARPRELDLSLWPMPPGEQVLEPRTATGIAANTVTWIPNLLVRGRSVNDYDGVVEMQDAINAKNSQVARVLLKHSDPKMAFPDEAFDESGNIRSDYDAFPFREAGKIPQYITWDGQLDAAMKDRAFFLTQLLVATETSPVLLGMKEGAAPDAYKKVRLESFNSLTKAQRKAVLWKAGTIRAVTVAQDLENTLPGVRYDRTPIAMEFRDGIPVDDKEQADTIAELRAAGVMSRRRGVEVQLSDPAAVEKEMAELEEESAAAMPGIFGGTASGGGGAVGGDTETDPAAGAAGDGAAAVEETAAAGGVR